MFAIGEVHETRVPKIHVSPVCYTGITHKNFLLWRISVGKIDTFGYSYYVKRNLSTKFAGKHVYSYLQKGKRENNPIKDLDRP